MMTSTDLCEPSMGVVCKGGIASRVKALNGYNTTLAIQTPPINHRHYDIAKLP
jgi:hypothetical protein